MHGEDGEDRSMDVYGDDGVDLSLDLTGVSGQARPVKSNEEEADNIMFSPRTQHRITALTEKEEDLSKMIDKGARLFNEGRYPEAKVQFESALDGARDLMSRCGQVYRLQERAPMQRALSAFEGKALYNLAHAELKLNMEEAALEHFTKAVPVVQKSGDWKVEVFCNVKIAQLARDRSVKIAALESVRSMLAKHHAPQSDLDQVDSRLQALRAASRPSSPAGALFGFFSPSPSPPPPLQKPAASAPVQPISNPASSDKVPLIKGLARPGTPAGLPAGPQALRKSLRPALKDLPPVRTNGTGNGGAPGRDEDEDEDEDGPANFGGPDASVDDPPVGPSDVDVNTGNENNSDDVEEEP